MTESGTHLQESSSISVSKVRNHPLLIGIRFFGGFSGGFGFVSGVLADKLAWLGAAPFHCL